MSTQVLHTLVVCLFIVVILLLVVVFFQPQSLLLKKQHKIVTEYNEVIQELQLEIVSLVEDGLEMKKNSYIAINSLKQTIHDQQDEIDRLEREIRKIKSET